jgi:predicted nucleic acid-binding protein
MNDARVVVVDASVAIKWVLSEPGDEQALSVLEAYGAREIELIAPRLLMEEVASALSKRCRRKQLTAKQAHAVFHAFESRRPPLADNPLRRALELSLDNQLSLWDSVYLALAIERRADLVTADRRFYRNVSRRYPFVSLIA